MPCFIRRWRFFILSLLAIALYGLSLRAACAQDHITQRGWLEDPAGQMAWPTVQEHPVQPYSGTLSKGFGDSVLWLRLRIDPNAQPVPSREADRLFLRIRPVYLDDIQVYDPLAVHGLVGITGDRHHPRVEEFQGLDFLIPIARGTQPRDIWVRLTSTSTRQIDVQALNITELDHQTYTQSLIFSTYIGLVIVLVIWGVVYWLFSHEKLIGAFSLKQTGALLFALASLGHMRALWPADWPAWLLDQVSSFFSITTLSTALWFHILLIREFDPPPWIGRVHQFLLALQPLKLLLLLGWTPIALRVNMTEVLVNPVIFTLSVVLARGWKQADPSKPTLSRWVVIGFYVLLMVILLGAALPALGITPGSEVALYVVQLHGLVSAFLILLMLQYRAHIIHMQQHQVAMALERSELQVVQEREIRAEQEKLLAMLAHELKTPLATMHMRLDSNANGSREIKQAIQDMNGVIERCQQTLQLSDRQLTPHADPVDLVNLMRDAVYSCAQPQRIALDLPDRLILPTDGQLWSIVVNNLLENACKYALPDTPIELKLKQQPVTGQIRLEISNHPGKTGWPDAEKIFEKYYRSPFAKRQAGTGLGLYLVRNLMHAMGGTIRYTPDTRLVRFVLEMPDTSCPN